MPLELVSFDNELYKDSMCFLERKTNYEKEARQSQEDLTKEANRKLKKTKRILKNYNESKQTKENERQPRKP